MQPIIQTTAGDSAPNETLSLVRENGNVIPLMNVTSVQLIIVSPITGMHTNDGSNTCTILDAPNGVVMYAWNTAGTDCPAPGTYKSYCRINYNNNTHETVPVRIEAGPAP